MNILFFLIPKSKVEYVYEDFSVRQVLEKMSYHRYSAIPILNDKGNYVGTITEGDILWHIKEKHDYSLKSAEADPLRAVAKKHDVRPIKSTEKVENLIRLAIGQNFIPVIDDSDTFIGIVTRKDIILYCADRMKDGEESPNK